MNNKKENLKEKYLFVNVDYSERAGEDADDGDGSRYSGYRHTIITIDTVGPAYYSEEGKYWRAKKVEEIDPKTDWDNIKSQIHMVFAIHSSGGTFGRTDGYFDVLYASDDLERTKEWTRNNMKHIEKRYNGYFDSLMEIRHEFVEIRNPEDISYNSDSKKWWEN